MAAATTRLVLAVALILGVVHSRPAAADTTEQLVARTLAQWNELEYEKVVELADTVLGAADATPQQRVEMLRLKGSALVVLDQPDDAAHVFDLLFAIDPDYDLPPRSSPRLLAVFAPARARWQVAEEQRLATELGPALRALEMHVRLPDHPRGGRPLEITVDLADPNAIADRIVLSRRRRGAGYYTTTAQHAHAGTLAFTLSADDTASPTPYVLELTLQAKHRSGVALRREGTTDRPLELGIAAGSVPTPSPITHRWWFWTGLVAVAVGGAFLIDQTISVGPQHVVGRP